MASVIIRIVIRDSLDLLFPLLFIKSCSNTGENYDTADHLNAGNLFINKDCRQDRCKYGLT